MMEDLNRKKDEVNNIKNSQYQSSQSSDAKNSYGKNEAHNMSSKQ